MQLTKANLDFVFYGLDQSFRKAYEGYATYWKQFATEIPSGTRENHYAWVGRLPKMRQWLGERQLKNYASRGYVLPNLDFELTLSLDRNDILDDQYGIYGKFAEDIGAQVGMWPDDQLALVLEAGATTAWAPDGQNFFSNAHPIDIDNPGGSTYQNNFDATGGGGSSSMPLTPANYQLVRAAMMQWKDESGRPMGIIPDLLIVPPQLEAQGKQILESQFVAPTGIIGAGAADTVQESVTRGTAKPLVLPLLSNATAWYLACTTRPLKPLVWQLRQAPQFVYKNNVTDDNVFFEKKFIFGADARGAAGFGLPFLIARANS